MLLYPGEPKYCPDISNKEDILVKSLINPFLRLSQFPGKSYLKNAPKKQSSRIFWSFQHTGFIFQMKNIIYAHWNIIQDLPGCQLQPHEASWMSFGLEIIVNTGLVGVQGHMYLNRRRRADHVVDFFPFNHQLPSCSTEG